MTLVAAIMAVSAANAQVYVGGGVGIGSTDNGDESATFYKFVPEIGYNLDKNWAVGVALGWTGTGKGGQKSFEINPYARYTFIHSQYINVFVDGGLGYAHDYNAGADDDHMYIGVKPGLAVNLSSKLSFVTHVGFLGYDHVKYNNLDRKANTWGLDVDGRNIIFGLYYNF